MPVQYRGILEEHRAVRDARRPLRRQPHGRDRGARAGTPLAVCQRLTTNDVARLGDGHAQYTLLCREDGGVVDDVIVYRLAAERFFFCVNASQQRQGPRVDRASTRGAPRSSTAAPSYGADRAAGTARRRASCDR